MRLFFIPTRSNNGIMEGFLRRYGQKIREGFYYV